MSAACDERESCANGQMYFYADAATDSWCGNLEEMSDESQIMDYIQHGNPRLFQRLRGMQFASSDIPLSYKGFRTLRKAVEYQQARPNNTQLPRCEMLDNDNLSLKAQCKVSLTNSNVDIRDRCKPDILHSLRDGYTLILFRCSAKYADVHCQYHSCRLGTPTTSNLLFLRLNCPTSSSSSSPTTLSICFHLQCLESIFNGHNPTNPKRLGEMGDLHSSSMIDVSKSLDGIGHDVIMDAARSLHQERVGEKIREKVNLPGDTTSPGMQQWETEMLVRKHKDLEIDEILREVARYEASRPLMKSRSRTSSPDLLITRMPYMEKQEERYKKQGLTAHQGRMASIEQAIERKTSALLAMQDQERALTACMNERHYYCRESDNGNQEMIHCSSNWCTIGWFHLACTDLERLPVVGQKFYCEYCRDDYGLFRPDSEKLATPEISDKLGFTTLTDNSEEDESPAGDDEDSHESLENETEAIEEDLHSMTTTEEVQKVQESSIGSADEPTTIMCTPTSANSWGTPINSPAGKRYLEENEMIKEPVSPTPRPKRIRIARAQDQVDGCPGTDGERQITENEGASDHDQPFSPTVSLAYEMDSSTITSTSQSVTSKALPLDPTAVKFCDLAPFIVAEGLTDEQMVVFQEWKAEYTRLSVLIQHIDEDRSLGTDQRKRTAEGVAESHDKSCKDGTEGQALSELLEDVYIKH